jgi:hypothetical protein
MLKTLWTKLTGFWTSLDSNTLIGSIAVGVRKALTKPLEMLLQALNTSQPKRLILGTLIAILLIGAFLIWMF